MDFRDWLLLALVAFDLLVIGLCLTATATKTEPPDTEIEERK